MKTDIQEHTVEVQVVDALRTGLGNRLVSVVLFGSRARGSARTDSDWDFLIIADDLPASHFERLILLKKLLPGTCRGAVSLLAKTPHEFESGHASIYLDIALDGIVLHDTADYISKFLSGLRDRTRQVGLYRIYTDEGDLLWRWRDQPSLTWSIKEEMSCLSRMRRIIG